MKNNPKFQYSKKPEEPKEPTKRGPYCKTRGPDGLTPFERLTIAKAEAQEFENKRNSEHWQTRVEAEAAAQETAEVIQGDLYGSLPLSLAGKLCGKVFTAPEVRLIIRDEIDGMVRQWVKGGRVSEAAIVKA